MWQLRALNRPLKLDLNHYIDFQKQKSLEKNGQSDSNCLGLCFISRARFDPRAEENLSSKDIQDTKLSTSAQMETAIRKSN